MNFRKRLRPIPYRPQGELLATASRTETVLLADLSTEHVAATRDQFRFLPDRR